MLDTVRPYTVRRRVDGNAHEETHVAVPAPARCRVPDQLPACADPCDVTSSPSGGDVEGDAPDGDEVAVLGLGAGVSVDYLHLRKQFRGRHSAKITQRQCMVVLSPAWHFVQVGVHSTPCPARACGEGGSCVRSPGRLPHVADPAVGCAVQPEGVVAIGLHVLGVHVPLEVDGEGLEAAVLQRGGEAVQRRLRADRADVGWGRQLSGSGEGCFAACSCFCTRQTPRLAAMSTRLQALQPAVLHGMPVWVPLCRASRVCPHLPAQPHIVGQRALKLHPTVAHAPYPAGQEGGRLEAGSCRAEPGWDQYGVFAAAVPAATVGSYGCGLEACLEAKRRRSPLYGLAEAARFSP